MVGLIRVVGARSHTLRYLDLSLLPNGEALRLVADLVGVVIVVANVVIVTANS